MRILTLAILASVLTVAADNPFVGTWTMNKGKSKLDPNGPKLDSMIVKFVQDGPTMKAIVTTNGTTGPAVAIDGREQLMPANLPGPGGSTHHRSTLKQREIYTKFNKDGKTIATRTVSLGADGKTMTSVIQGRLPNGQTIKSVAVFDKQ